MARVEYNPEHCERDWWPKPKGEVLLLVVGVVVS